MISPAAGARRLLRLPAAALRHRRLRRPARRAGPLGHRQRRRSMRCRSAVYCTAWTYFGSVGRAATGGIWFLPIYLGPMLAMLLGLDRACARWSASPATYRITSIADFIASRYGKSPLPRRAGHADHRRRHRPLHRAAAEGGLRRLPAADRRPGAAPRRPPGGATARSTSRWRSPPSPSSSAPATSTSPSGTRAWSPPSPSSSLVKLVAFLAVGGFVTWGLFDGMADIWAAGAGGARARSACSASAAAGRGRLRLRPVVRADPALRCSRCCCCRGSSR